jgi:hypothetical protein
MTEETNKNTAALDTTPPGPKKVEKVEEEKVEVSKATLDAILDRLEKMDTANKKKDDEIEMLKSISDRGRLTKWEEQNKGALIRTANVAFWEGNPILAWKKVTDEVGFREGRLVVNQTIKIFVDEGGKQPKEIVLEYLFWAQNTTSMPGEVVNKNIGKAGEVWTIQLKDGRKIELDIRFINAF